MTDDELLRTVQDIRKRGNGRWIYDLASIAMDRDPEAIVLMDFINLKNRRIEFLDQELVRAVATTRSDAEIIDEMQAIREVNNTAWMNIMRIAFREAPEEARTVVRQIISNDQSISKLSEELAGK